MFFQLDTEGGARRGRAEKQAGALSLEPGPSARGMFVLLNPVSVFLFKWSSLSFILIIFILIFCNPLQHGLGLGKKKIGEHLI